MAAAQPGRGAFLSDIETLRRRAREHIAQGAVTPGYHADRSVVLKLLNEALATEIICTLRYKRHYYMTPIERERRLGLADRREHWAGMAAA